MRTSVLVIASLAFAGYGRRVQTPNEHRQLRKHRRSDKALAALLSTVDPASAWQAVGARYLRGCPMNNPSGAGRHGCIMAINNLRGNYSNSRSAKLVMQGSATAEDRGLNEEPEFLEEFEDGEEFEDFEEGDGPWDEYVEPMFEAEEVFPEIPMAKSKKEKKKSALPGNDSLEGFAKRWKLPVPVPQGVLERLREAGYWRPMMVQERAMPMIAEGESVVIHSATGSGKTLAFLVPLVARMEREPSFRVLVAVPSQELAVQIAAETELLMPADSANRILLAITSSKEIEFEQQDKLFDTQQLPQILIGTPQRLASLCRHPRARTMVREVGAMVLDEVDSLLPPVPKDRDGQKMDLQTGGGWGAKGWNARSLEEVAYVKRKISKRPTGILIETVLRYRPRSAPNLQIISCSATITSDLRRQVAGLLNMPEKGKKAAGTVVTSDPAHKAPKSLKKLGVAGVSMPSTIRHTAYIGNSNNLRQMLQVAFLEYLPQAGLVVVPNRKSVPDMVDELRMSGYKNAEALNDALEIVAADISDKRQRPGKGQTLQSYIVNKRKELSKAFASKADDIPLLVTNEHSARGMDFKFIDCVILAGLPQHIDSYIHVVGRTGREGRKGVAISLLTDDDECARLAVFRKELGCTIQEVDMRFL